MSRSLSEFSEDELMTIPDEKDYKDEIAQIKKRTGEFNITHYTFILSKEEKDVFDKIMAKVPADRRVYIQYTLRKQFRKIRSEYEKWLKEQAKTEEELDMPDIQVKMPRDEGETNLVQDEW